MMTGSLEGEDPAFMWTIRRKNLVPARALGWHTVIADPEGRWMEEVSQLLKQQR